MSFGEFIKEKRLLIEGLTVRKLAAKLNISFTYLSDVENGRAKAFKPEILKKLAEILNLNENEKEQFYNLAGESQNTMPYDITEKVLSRPELIAAFRKVIKDEEKGGLK